MTFNSRNEANSHMENRLFQAYLRDIATYPLATRAEEQELAQRIQRLQDPKAIERLMLANLRLVLRVAFKYRFLDMPMMDLISQGNIGLHKATLKFHPGGCKFSSFAANSIKYEILNAVENHDSVIRIPTHIREFIIKVSKTRNSLRMQLGREPTQQETATALGVSKKRLADTDKNILKIISLSQPLDSDNSTTIGDVTPDNSELAMPGKEVEEPKDKLRKILAQVKLTGIERRVIILRFGIDQDRPLKIRETAKAIKLSNTRVKQLQESALNKLRTHLRKQRITGLSEV